MSKDSDTTKLDDILSEIKTLRSENRSATADMHLMAITLRQAVDRLKALETDTHDIKSDLRRQEVLGEDMNSDIKAILEHVAPLMETSTNHSNQLKDHDETLTAHERSINLLIKKTA